MLVMCLFIQLLFNRTPTKYRAPSQASGRERRTVRLRWHGFKDKTFYTEKLIFLFPVAQEWDDFKGKVSFNHSWKQLHLQGNHRDSCLSPWMWVGSCLILTISITSSSWQAQSHGESWVSVGSQSDLRGQCSDISVILIHIPVLYLDWNPLPSMKHVWEILNHRKRSAHTQESRTKLWYRFSGTEGLWGLLDG